MAMSGMITFVLLVFLIDCLNGQNIPKHPERVMIRTRGRAARIKCIVDSSTLQSSPLHWYRVQSGGAFQRLMYFEAGKQKPINDQGVPRRYAGSVSGTEVTLTISGLQFDDAGSYYCAFWTDSNKKVFGSGTRLYVTDQGKDKVIPPKLSGYLPSGKSTSEKKPMLCQASGMFPDLVTFTWEMQTGTEKWTAVSKDIVEQSNSENSKVISVTSMMIVDKNTAKDNVYRCIANHEGGAELKPIKLEKDNKGSKDEKKSDEPDTTCPPSPDQTVAKKQISGNSDQMPSLYLFVYAYAAMLMKNGVYFCAVSIFLLKSKFGKKE